MTEGFDIAKAKALQVLEEVKISKDVDRDTLISVARTSLRTKVNSDLADHLTEVCVKYTEMPFFLISQEFLIFTNLDCQ